MARELELTKNARYSTHISGARWGMLLLFLLASIAPSAHAQWTQSWSDEFDGPAGTFPDPTIWTFDVGGDGWGNAGLEVYCAAGSNAAPSSAATTNVITEGKGNLGSRAIRTPRGTWTSTRM